MTDRAPFLFPVRVYYEDTDVSGVVYHASYLRFLERGRTEWLRALGIDQTTFLAASEPQAFAFAVRRMTIDFLRAARMDDLLAVETRVRRIGGASLDLSQRVWRGEDVLTAAEVRIGGVVRGRPARLPAAIRAKFVG